jgi:RsiW-degrading membrane proteinase PrsW (M82 family)
MERLSRQLYFIGPNPEAMARQLAPLLTRPGVIGVALTYFAVIVPLLEELIKPLGVWLFANRLSSPAQGFALGALSGAGYALIETLGVSAQTAEWASLLLSRIGTGILHITASALMGGAIAYAVRERRYFRLFRTYLASVSLHGLWNTLAILYTFSTLTEYTEQQGFLAGLQLPVSIGMGILAVAMLGILILSNRRMSSTIPQEPSEQLL